MAIGDAGLGVEYTSLDPFFEFILNDLFKPAVADTVINPNVLLRTLSRREDRVEGRNVVFPIHVGRNMGINSISPEGLLPDPGQQDYAQYAYAVRHTYGRIKFGGISLDASKTRIASWLNALQSEVQGLGTDMARYRQRVYHNDGSGRVGDVVSSGGVTVQVRVHAGIDGVTVDEDPLRQIKVGMRLVAVDAASGPAWASRVGVMTVTAVGVTAADEIQVDALAAALAPNDFLVIASSVDSSALNDTTWQNDPMGIAGIINDGNPDDGTPTGFQGVDATLASNSWHRAQINSGGGTNRTLSLNLMQQIWDAPFELADSTIGMFIMPFGVLRAYADTVLTDRRFTGSAEPQSFDGGYDALSYNGAPLIPDRDCYSNRMYGLSMDDICFDVMADPQWMQMDGSIYHRVENRDQYQATMFVRETMSSEVRDKHILATDIAHL